MKTPSRKTTNKLSDYLKASKSLLAKPLSHKEKAIGVTMAIGVLGALQSVDAQIVYSGTQNIGCVLPTNFNTCYANIDLAGSNDLRIRNNTSGAITFIQVNEVLGGGFNINGFLGNAVAGYVYPYALNSGVTVGPAGPWNFATMDQNTLADSGVYPGQRWELPNNTTRFLGIRSTGPVRYGWVRIRVNGFRDYTIVDWAFKNTPNTPIVTGIASAADASISGRVFTSTGRGLPRARVTATDSTGRVLTASTSSFGYYRIEGLESGGTVTVTVESKGLRFQPRVLNLGNSLDDVDFTPDSGN